MKCSSMKLVSKYAHGRARHKMEFARLRLNLLEDRCVLAPLVFTASGPDRASIQAAVDQFRTLLGPLNPYVNGTQNGGAGRREANWDDVPSSLTDPAQFPENFYNRVNNSPRGVEITYNQFQSFIVSPPLSDGANAAPWHFQPFSSPRVLGALGSDFKLGGYHRSVPLDFFVPGSSTRATVRGFGAVFSDVDQPETAPSIQFQSVDGKNLGDFKAPAFSEGVSFLGVIFDTEQVKHVSIGLGLRLYMPESHLEDVVALDDMIFSEPVGYSPPPVTQLLATGAGAGAQPVVRVSRDDGTPLIDFNAFDPNFRGGVHVATGDVTGDGIEDLIVGAGAGGGPHVRVFDGGALLNGYVQQIAGPGGSFYAYDPNFTGGVFVTAGDIYGTDRRSEIITGAGAGGGPHVVVYDVATGERYTEFFAYDPEFRGGVTVASGDVDGDLQAEVITGAGPGGGPHVQTFDGAALARHDIARLDAPYGSYYAYDPGFTGGVTVAAGDTDGDGRAEIITGAGAGGGPHVQVFDGLSLVRLQSFYALDSSFAGGVNVSVANVVGDRRNEIIVGAGPGGQPIVRWFDDSIRRDYLAFDSEFQGGVFVG